LPTLLDARFDELAASVHGSVRPRIVAAAAAGLVALFVEPWPICLAWTAGLVGAEIWSWFATRQQYLGVAVTRWRRLEYLATLVAGIGGWFLLGVLCWTHGGVTGALCAMVIWLSIMGFAQTHAYQSTLGYLVAGAAPAAGMLAVVGLVPNAAVPGLAPVWLMLLIGVTFAISGARQMMSARKTFDELIGELRASEASYRLLADNATDVISLSGPQGERLYVSPSIERNLGFRPGELLQTPNYTNLYAEDADAVRAFIGSVTTETGEKTMEYRVHRKDGSLIWAETTFSRLNDGSDRMLAISRDVTHRKQLEGELVDALTKSEAAAAAKADFLANMTHELRTPLNAIIGFSGVLKTSKSLTDLDARHVGLIQDASATLLSVVSDVLDYSKLEAGGFELDPQPFDPAELARSVAAIVDHQAQAKGLSLSVLDDGIDRVMVGDAPRLRQVLLNFLSNALKFTHNGAVELAVAQQLHQDGGRLRMEVHDTGIGIPADQIDAVFMRFTQADASISRQFGGTGLGLAISKQIIEKMGGEIGATSTAGQGSTFWFEVPLPLADEARAAAAPRHTPEDFDRPMRVLLVDDNAVNRELVAALLSAFNVEIDTAVDGAQAIEAYSRERYDIVLMDVQMPVMDGLSATLRIRALETADRRTPIIAMTANVLPEQIERCREAGMDDHLGKPISPARLLETLARWTQAGAEKPDQESPAQSSDTPDGFALTTGLG